MIYQEKYIKELLNIFHMSDAKPINTPIGTSSKLDTDEPGTRVNETMYWGIMGAPLYLTTSRPYSVFSVGTCARFQTFPKESHLKAAKRNLRYLKGTGDLVLYYHSSNFFDLIGYADADYAAPLEWHTSWDRAWSHGEPSI